jgi:hypothetical protein
VFNFDTTEVAANPVHLMYVLEQQIEREQFPRDRAEVPVLHQGHLARATPSSSARKSRPPTWSRIRIRPEHLRPLRHLCRLLDPGPGIPRPDTGESFDRAALNAELEKIEKPAGISNPKDFRNEIVNFVLRARANNGGKNPLWTSYEKLRVVIEKKMFSNTEELLPVISFNAKATNAESTRTSSTAWSARATRPSRCACCANGTCACASPRSAAQRIAGRPVRQTRRRAPGGPPTTSRRAMLHQIIDRRLAGKNKSIGNRERFLRRFKGAATFGGRRARPQHHRSRKGREASIPQGHLRALLPPRPGGSAKLCIRQDMQATRIRAPRAAAAAAQRRNDGEARTTSPSN